MSFGKTELICMCMSLCTTVVHIAAQNNSDNFPFYPQTVIITQMSATGGKRIPKSIIGMLVYIFEANELVGGYHHSVHDAYNARPMHHFFLLSITHNHNHFHDLPSCTALPPLPSSVLVSHPGREPVDISGADFLHTGCPFSHPTSSIKALTVTCDLGNHQQASSFTQLPPGSFSPALQRRAVDIGI